MICLEAELHSQSMGHTAKICSSEQESPAENVLFSQGVQLLYIFAYLLSQPSAGMCKTKKATHSLKIIFQKIAIFLKKGTR